MATCAPALFLERERVELHAAAVCSVAKEAADNAHGVADGSLRVQRVAN
jgi:hypothetical protein